MKKLILIACLAFAGCDNSPPKPTLEQATPVEKVISAGLLEIVSEQEYNGTMYRVIRNKETSEKFLVLIRGGTYDGTMAVSAIQNEKLAALSLA